MSSHLVKFVKRLQVAGLETVAQNGCRGSRISAVIILWDLGVEFRHQASI
jgi:hypothetical protein